MKENFPSRGCLVERSFLAVSELCCQSLSSNLFASQALLPGKGKSQQYPFPINKEDVKMAQWLESSCLGESAPALGMKEGLEILKKLPFFTAGRDVIMPYWKHTMPSQPTPKHDARRHCAVCLLSAPRTGSRKRAPLGEVSSFSSSKSSPRFPCQGACSGAGC